MIGAPTSADDESSNEAATNGLAHMDAARERYRQAGRAAIRGSPGQADQNHCAAASEVMGSGFTHWVRSDSW